MRLTKRISGFTMVEMLVALAVLGVALSLSYGTIVSGLRGQNQQEDIVNAQSKARRITEVVSQDIRSSILGGISNIPYASSHTAVSFMLLDGGAGYQIEASNPNDLKGSNKFNIVADVDAVSELRSQLKGQQALIINGADRKAIVVDVKTIRSTADDVIWQVVMTQKCDNMIDYAANTLLFAITTMGIDFNKDKEILYQATTAGTEAPMAFDVGDFVINYVYEGDDESILVKDVPEQSTSAIPSRQFTKGGVTYTLARLQVIMSSSDSDGQKATRTYSSEIELARSQDFQVNEVLVCN